MMKKSSLTTQYLHKVHKTMEAQTKTSAPTYPRKMWRICKWDTFPTEYQVVRRTEKTIWYEDVDWKGRPEVTQERTEFGSYPAWLETWQEAVEFKRRRLKDDIQAAVEGVARCTKELADYDKKVAEVAK